MEENKVMNIELTPEMFEKLDDSKKNSEKIAYESKTYIADAWNRFKKNKLALIGLCFLLVMAIGCIFVPIFSSYTYDGQNMANTLVLTVLVVMYWLGLCTVGGSHLQLDSQPQLFLYVLGLLMGLSLDMLAEKSI